MAETGGRGRGQRLQEAPSKHEIAPFRFLIAPETAGPRSLTGPVWHSGGALHVFYLYAARA
jgi:hypothetical protein